MQAWIDSFRSIVDNPTLGFSSSKIRIKLPAGSPEEIAIDEDFWEAIRQDFSLSTDIINLNNGAVSSSPTVVEKAFLHYYKLVNSAPSFYIWKIMEGAREVIREGLSQLINASANEIAILRNTTEASNNVIFGIPLSEGDEVVLCRQDYAKVVSSWKQRELREGVKLCWVDLQPAIDSDEDIVSKYTTLFSERTKVVQLTHVINWNGQVMPVELIIKEAKQRGIEVILDGAHSFGKLETDMEKLGCDYFFTALHKWLSGPIPSSLLYIRKDKIGKMWPLASSTKPQSDDIRKFEELSIQLYPNILALGFAIEYYFKIGRTTKEMRLRDLRRTWTGKLATKPGLQFNTPLEEQRCCTIVNIAIQGWEPKELEEHLLKAHFIHVGIVTQPSMKGIRITPNIYTDPKQLDYFVEAMGMVEPR
ncbi:MAG TPA: aminotransferase class V-fold PLP-dependent enzyme [Chitinophagaceae bacterium]|nr:aminotransferase class V-fold PLP-dependent enzyme [Chitinophagaceae bacterium]